NLGQMLLTTHLQEQHLFLFFVYLFFVNRLCLLHVRYNLCFYRFANHNFHAFVLCQYLHFFFFLVLFDYYISCPLVYLVLLFFLFICFFLIVYFFYTFVIIYVFIVLKIIIFMRWLSVNIFIRSTFSFSLIM